MSSLGVSDDEGNILMVNDDIIKPIIDVETKRIGKECYILHQDKAFVKAHKFLLIEKIYDLNSKMLLSVINQKKEKMSLRIERDDDFFNGMLLYTKTVKNKTK